MSLDKNYIKIISFRLWWHLDNSNELDASFDIAREFYNSVKNQYPKRTRNQINPHKVKIEIYNKKSELKFDILNDEFITTLESDNPNKSDFDFLKKEAIDKRDLLLEILSNLKIDNTHLHQDFALVYFYNLNEVKELHSRFKEIGINFDLSFQDDNQLLNLNISSQYENNDLGKTSYDIATGIHNNEKGIIIQVQHSSPKLHVEKNDLDDWFNKIINSKITFSNV